MTRHDPGSGAYEPAPDRWNDAQPPAHVTPSYDLVTAGQRDDNPMTWPSAVFPSQTYQHSAGLLTLNALLAPDLPRPALPNWTQVPNRFHIWPALASATWAGLGFWAHTEPLHALMAAGFCVAGTVAAGFGAFGIAVGNVIARDADSEQPDKAGTRGLLGGGLAAFAGAASTGAGFSGIGCMLAAGTVAAGYGAYFGWQRHNRHQAIQAVIAFAAASNPGPMPPGMPLPPLQMPGPANPYEARIQAALEPLRITGTWLGSPRQLADDVWSIPFELPAGANMSPEALAKKAPVLANNAKARRLEIEPTHGPRGVFTIYDGPDRTDDDYPWAGTTITSIDQPALIGVDEAARPAKLAVVGRLLVAGASGSGKSQFLNSLLLSTLPCTDLVRIGVDCKPGAPELGPYEPVMHYLAKDPMYAMAVLYGIREVIKERGQILSENSAPSILNEDGIPVRKWKYEYGPRIVVVTDEVAELVRWEPGAPKLLESNRQLGRFVAVDPWDAMQGPSASAFGGNTDGRQQYDIRIGFQSEGVVNNMVFGQGASGDGWRLEKLDGIGKFLISAAGFKKPRPIKGLVSNDRTVADRVAHWAPRISGMDERSAAAFQRGFDAYLAEIAEKGGPSAPVGGGPGGGMPDPIEAAQDFHTGRPVLWIVPKYPDGEPIEAKYRAMWDLLGSYGSNGEFAKYLAAKKLDGLTSESKVRELMTFWKERGYVVGEKDGRAERFMRADRVSAADRRQA